VAGDFNRRDIWFDSGGDRCAAWLYEPRKSVFDGACVVMANGASLTRHDGLPAFAERFAGGGVTTVVFDHRCLGDSEGIPRQRIRFAQQQEDWRNAVTFARSLPACNPDRVALWGFSMSGIHVVQTAVADERLVAAIVLCPAVGARQRVAATPPRAVA
jgi:dienelactone hydrolase